MTDSISPFGALPGPLAVDPGRGAAAALPAVEALRGAGPLVLLLAQEDEREWAARAAVALAEALAQEGRRVVLSDLQLERPVLHEVLGRQNLEGVSDIFLYGASLSRSAHPVEGRGFYFISAGTYTAAPESVYEHPRWAKLAAGFGDAGAVMLAYAPATGAAAEALASRADAAVLLGRFPGGGLPDTFPDHLPVRALLVPPGAEEPAAAIEPEPPPVEPVAAADPFGAADPADALPEPPEPDEPHEVEGVAAAPVGVEEPPSADSELRLPPAPVRQRRRRRGPAVLLWVLLGAVLLAAAGYLLASTRPELVPWLNAEPAGAEPAPAQSREPAPPPVAVGDPLPYSVQVKAFASLPAAVAQLEEYRREFEGAPLFLSPEEIEGRVYYKILAGQLPDTSAANELRARLLEERMVDREDAAGTWDLVRYTPLAYDLGEYAARSEAESAADSLRARDVHGYPVALPYSDGSQRWRLYAGAYRDSTSAEAMRRVVQDAGLEAVLVPRVGLRPVVQK